MTHTNATLEKIEAAAAAGKLSPGAVANLRTWLTDPRYAEYVPQVAERIAADKWQELDDVFWTVIPFGTGGRRGRMHPIGTNAINDRTMGESAQGLANYVRRHVTGKPLSCAIAYDTRHRSRHFAELSAGIMAAAGFTVFFLDGHRSTPEISFAVRYKRCDCGIMITASHNPPSDNALKVYWSTGGQLLPPHDKGVIEQVMTVGRIERIDFSEGLAAGRIVYCQEEVDAAFIDAVLVQAIPGPRQLKILYTPLHGVGATAVVPALEGDGFADVEVFAPHADPDPEFPNVPDHVANPENPAVFGAPIARARQIGADIILATDPDADRLGCAAPLTNRSGAEWKTLTGNQIGALLADYLLEVRKVAGTLSPDDYVVKTLVTTELIRRVADHYGVTMVGDLMVGFKWIGGVMDERDPKRFLLGAEESYGFLVGDHIRDKDAAVAGMLLCELAARLKAAGRTLHDRLAELFRQYGCHSEKTVSATMPGSEGMDRMKALMARLRSEPPRELAGIAVAKARDYLNGKIIPPEGAPTPLEGPRGDMVILDLAAEGNYAAVRPSGTEPKVKFYLFAYDPPRASQDPSAILAAQAERLDALEGDLRAYARA